MTLPFTQRKGQSLPNVWNDLGSICPLTPCPDTPPLLSWLLPHCVPCSFMNVPAAPTSGFCSSNSLCLKCSSCSYSWLTPRPFQVSLRFAQTTFLMPPLAHPQQSQFPSFCSTFFLVHSASHLLTYYIKLLIYDLVTFLSFPCIMQATWGYNFCLSSLERSGSRAGTQCWISGWEKTDALGIKILRLPASQLQGALTARVEHILTPIMLHLRLKALHPLVL